MGDGEPASSVLPRYRATEDRPLNILCRLNVTLTAGGKFMDVPQAIGRLISSAGIAILGISIATFYVAPAIIQITTMAHQVQAAL